MIIVWLLASWFQKEEENWDQHDKDLIIDEIYDEKLDWLATSHQRLQTNKRIKLELIQATCNQNILSYQTRCFINLGKLYKQYDTKK